jgi:hypothetical protein
MLLTKISGSGFILAGILLLACLPGLGQRQLTLIRGDVLIHRFQVGDNFHCILNDNKGEHWGFLVEVNEFSIITSQDTINLKDIRRVLEPDKKPVINIVGQWLVKVGLFYFLIDQFNNTVVHQNSPRLEPYVWKPAAVLVATGLPMLLFRKKWKKISGRVKLISIDKDSRYYSIYK